MDRNYLYQLISEIECNRVFTQIEDFLFVNLDLLINRNHQFEGVNEFLFYIGQHKDKQIVFLQTDGANLRFSGILEIIKQTIKDTRNRCYLYGVNDPKIENCTFLQFDEIKICLSMCYFYLKDLPISTLTPNKKFAGLFGRYDLYRLKLYKHLRQNYLTDSVLSWNSKNIIYNHRHVEHFKDDAEWFEQTGVCNLDYNTNNNFVPPEHSLRDIKYHYQSYFIEIVSETDVHNNKFFSEKTLKNFYLGKPFLLLNGQGSLEHLRSYGFKTFAPYIDESYDDMPSVYDRIKAITQEIDRLATLDLSTCREINEKLLPVFEHNRKVFCLIAKR